MSMQYGHCVVAAAATAISSFIFTGIAPSDIAALSKARKPSLAAGASSPNFASLLRIAASYMTASFGFRGIDGDSPGGGVANRRAGRRLDDRSAPGVSGQGATTDPGSSTDKTDHLRCLT